MAQSHKRCSKDVRDNISLTEKKLITWMLSIAGLLIAAVGMTVAALKLF